MLGHEFLTSALASIADVDVSTALDAIAHAERAGLLRALSFGTRYAFVHDLVREAIYSGLSAGERAAIHRRAAASMTDHDDDFQVTARAHHALAALPLGDIADAVALATAAGNRARDRLAFDEAARWYRQAHDAASADSAIGPTNPSGAPPLRRSRVAVGALAPGRGRSRGGGRRGGRLA